MIDNKTIRKVIMLNKLLPSGSPTYEDREASGAVANFTTNTVQPFVSLDCEILPIQEGTGDPSPSNPRPISGTDELMSTHTTYRTAETYTFDLGRTVYGGSAEVVGGTGEKTHEIITFDGSEAWNVHGSIASWFYLDGAFHDAFIDGEKNDFAVCNCGVQAKYQNVSDLTNGEFALGLTGNRIRFVFKNTDCATIEDFKTWLSSNNMQVAYTLDTPESFTFTGQPINSYLGVNNVWTDVGNTKVTYKYKTGEGGSTKKKYLPIFYDLYGEEKYK